MLHANKYASLMKLLLTSSFLILCSCETSLNPDLPPPNDFVGQISSSFGTAIIRPDMSLWFVSDELKDGQIAVVPFAKKYEKISSIISIELVEGMYFTADVQGNIWYWGYWAPSSTMPDPVIEPINICYLKGVKAIDFCSNKIYMLRSDSTVWQTEFLYSNPRKFLYASQIPGMGNIIKISNGFALSNNGTIYELEHREPEYGGYIDSLKDIVDIENTLGRRTYVVKKDGTVWGWGRNDFGELGDGTNKARPYSVQVKNLSGVIKISCNYDYNLALNKDGSVWFWGYTGRDEDNKPTAASEAVKIEGLGNVALTEASFISFFMKKDGSYWYYNVFTKELGEIFFN